MANRTIRRADRGRLGQLIADDPDHDAIELSLSKQHICKPKHWGSTLAADHREKRKALGETYQAIGGRAEMMIRSYETLLLTELDPALRAAYRNSLDWYLQKRKPIEKK